MRIGHGYDTHRFIEGVPLILGGVNIPYEYGLQAHSDGDAVIHALCDAVLGAAGLGDIGRFYPDTDDKYENIDSRILLRDVIKKISGQSLAVINADLTILAQAPKMMPHIPAMITNIASDINIDESAINIKATTSEEMGFIGRKEGLAVYAVVLLD